MRTDIGIKFFAITFIALILLVDVNFFVSGYWELGLCFSILVVIASYLLYIAWINKIYIISNNLHIRALKGGRLFRDIISIDNIIIANFGLVNYVESVISKQKDKLAISELNIIKKNLAIAKSWQFPWFYDPFKHTILYIQKKDGPSVVLVADMFSEKKMTSILEILQKNGVTIL